MITGLTWLLACKFVGEVVVRLLDVSVPGPVVGMLLLFVPAGVGVVAYAAIIRDNLLPLAVALVGS